MTQLKSQYDEVRTPLAKMTFSPDVPSTALGPNEYNIGQNVETDVRGVRSMAGDFIISTGPTMASGYTGQLIFVTSGFRGNGTYVNIVAYIVTQTSSGNKSTHWYQSSDTTTWTDITPNGSLSAYTLTTNITCVWNGTVPIFNDTLHPPFFWLDGDSVMKIYTNTPANNINYIDTSTYGNEIIVYFVTPYNSAYGSNPFIAGTSVTISNVNNLFNNTYTVTSSSSTQAILATTLLVGATYPNGVIGTVTPQYSWNYFPQYLSLTANFLRMYSTPNVGSILVAGGLTYVPLSNTATTEVFPVTVQWSQAFGLNTVPDTWQPTITNVANQLEVPLRGPVQDGFPSNGQFFICSYWDTVVFSPLNYTTTSAPILGVRLYNQGRGLLTSNCWANADTNVYGIDARDVWVFDGTNFTGIGNQRVKNWFFDQISPYYYNMIFMENNTAKNQIEIYYPDSHATNGIPNKMLSYRYDLDCWNSPRDISNGIAACESPIYEIGIAELSTRCITYADAINNVLIQKDLGTSWANNNPIYSQFRRDNIKLLPNYSGKLMVHRILPETVNIGATPFTGTFNTQIIPSTGNISIRIEGADSVGSSPAQTTDVTMSLNTNNPWCQIDQNSHRVNTIIIENTTVYDIWMTSAVTWQYTQTEDDR